ncbi:MAG: septation protein IspZ [Alphaproteobacteria bacterium]|nr:septation protein IspZ [Alphaproteobacteria bacterium]
MEDTIPSAPPRPKSRFMSMFSEIAPLAAFFLVNQAFGLYAAAVAAITASALLVAVTWALEKRLARFAVFATSIAALLTLAAILAEEKTYIKIQPSLFSGAFAAVLLIGRLRGKAMMKVFFVAQFDLPDAVWKSLSLRWGLFFLAATLANEVAWRALSDDDWVTFRVLIMAPATGFFMLAQLPITLRGQRDMKQIMAAQQAVEQAGNKID